MRCRSSSNSTHRNGPKSSAGYQAGQLVKDNRVEGRSQSAARAPSGHGIVAGLRVGRTQARYWAGGRYVMGHQAPTRTRLVQSGRNPDALDPARGRGMERPRRGMGWQESDDASSGRSPGHDRKEACQHQASPRPRAGCVMERNSRRSADPRSRYVSEEGLNVS
jgi:hypothetical protein